jgi:hypothetical protein
MPMPPKRPVSRSSPRQFLLWRSQVSLSSQFSLLRVPLFIYSKIHISVYKI